MSSSRDDLVYIEDMLARIRRVLAKTDGVAWEEFRDNQDLHDIAERSVSVIGEAALKLSEGFRTAHAEIPWREAMGIRHKIVHDYFEVSYSILWSVIREQLPDLEQRLAAVLEAEARNAE